MFYPRARMTFTKSVGYIGNCIHLGIIYKHLQRRWISTIILWFIILSPVLFVNSNADFSYLWLYTMMQETRGVGAGLDKRKSVQDVSISIMHLSLSNNFPVSHLQTLCYFIITEQKIIRIWPIICNLTTKGLIFESHQQHIKIYNL